MDGDFKGDFTRDTFEPFRHFSRVLMQQGRVQLDADWNEQTDLLLYALRRLIIDLVGPYWGTFDFEVDPSKTFNVGDIKLNSFKIAPQKDASNNVVLNDFSIASGHYYVDGILAKSGKGINYQSQPTAHIPGEDQFSPGVFYLVYLDVWEQQITFLEDNNIREVALGENGPDTATRAEIVWQVRAKAASEIPTLQDTDRITRSEKGAARVELAEDFTEEVLKHLQSRFRGELKAQSKFPPDPDTDVCIIPPDSRFRGDENQLYRVEVHKGGTAADGATFKWSRENGSVVFPIDKLDPGETETTVIVGNLGRDDRLTLEPGDWVEIVDDDYILQVAGRLDGKVNPLLQVHTIETLDQGTTQVILKGTLSGASFPDVGLKEGEHRLLRRWDQKEGTGKKGEAPKLDKNGSGTIPIKEGITEDAWLVLEDGVQIQFQPSGTTADKSSEKNPAMTYRTGDYWLIPARTVIGDVLWPRKEVKSGQTVHYEPLALPPHGVRHHYALLAVVVFGGNEVVSVKVDLRYMVPPLGKVAALIDAFQPVGL